MVEVCQIDAKFLSTALSAKFSNNKRKQALPVWRVLESLCAKSLLNRDNDANSSTGGLRKVGGWSSKIYFYKVIFLNLYFTDGDESIQLVVIIFN